MSGKEIWKSIEGFVRRMFRLYEKEIKLFVEDMIDKAYKNMEAVKVRSISPAIRRNVRNKILADIIIMKIDTTTNAGKSEVARLVLDAMNWATKESE